MSEEMRHAAALRLLNHLAGPSKYKDAREIVDMIVAVRDELGPKPQPEPDKCEECGETLPNHGGVGDGTKGPPRPMCSRATPPSAKGAAEGMPAEIQVWTHLGVARWQDSKSCPPNMGPKYIRADEVERRVAHARSELDLELRTTLAQILGQEKTEGIIATARRVVAERDEWERQATDPVDGLEAKRAELDAALARVRELESDLARMTDGYCDAMGHVQSWRIQAGQAEARLERAQVQLRDAAIGADGTVARERERAETAERELGEARATIQELRNSLTSLGNKALEWSK